MAKSGVVFEGTNEHTVMTLLAANGNSAEWHAFRAALETALPDRAGKTLNAILDRMRSEGFVERRVVLTERGQAALAGCAARKDLPPPKTVANLVIPVTKPRIKEGPPPAPPPPKVPRQKPPLMPSTKALANTSVFPRPSVFQVTKSK